MNYKESQTLLVNEQQNPMDKPVLPESEDIFPVLIDNTSVLMWSSDRQGSFTFFNQAWLEFRGRSKDEEISFGWIEGIYIDDLELYCQTYQKYLEKQENFQREFRLCRADGEYRWIMERVKPRFNSAGEFLGFIGSCLDITESKQTQIELAQVKIALAKEKQHSKDLEEKNRKLQSEIDQRQKVEQEIQESEQRCLLTIKSNNDAVFDLDLKTAMEDTLSDSEIRYRELVESQDQVLLCRWLPDTTLTFVNQSYCKFFGKSAAELVGTKFLDLIPENIRENVVKFKESLCSSKKLQVSYFQHFQISGTGKKRWFNWTDQPIIDKNGNLVEFQSFGIDITEQKQKEDALFLITQGIASRTGDDFFRSCVRCLAEALEVTYACISEWIEPQKQRLHIVKCWTGENYLEDHLDYEISGTPCANVLKNSTCYYPEKVQEQFPDDLYLVQFGVESYFGIPLINSQGAVIGNLCVMDKVPMTITKDKEMILQIFAARVGAELERKQTEEGIIKRAERDNLLTQISRSMLDQDIDKTINFALETIGKYLESDRSYLFQINEHNISSMTHEWCNQGIEASIDLYQNYSLSACDPLFEEYTNQKVFYIPNVADLPLKYQWEKEELESQSIKSILVLHIEHYGQNIGYIGLDAVKNTKQWQEDEITFLTLVAELIAITKLRHEAEQKLKQSQQKLSFLVGHTPLAILEYNNNTEIISWNQGAEAMFGYTPDEIMGKPCLQLMVPDTEIETVKDVIEMMSKSKKSSHNVNENITKDGRIITCEWFNNPLLDPHGSLIGFASIAVNVTHRQQTELALKQAALAAESANQAKSNFLASMSHELRTPLNSILGFTQLLNNDQTLNERQQQYIEIINRNGQHLLTLINDVLSMSQIEVGKVTLKENLFNLSVFLYSFREMLQFKANQKGLDFIIYSDDSLPQYIQADETKLRQVILNLLSNAIKFTQNGHIILRVKILPNNPHRLHFEIEDTGVGIADEEIDCLFEPFLQTTSGRDSGQGSGLGLAISQKFVQLMGGEIKVNSKLGCGSIFAFDINFNLASQENHNLLVNSEIIIDSNSYQNNFRILVVDDRSETRQLLIEILENINVQVREASNGKEAVAICQSWQPDIVLMDMRMPIMDGYEATKLIKAQESDQGKVPIIIAITASVFEYEREAMLAAGCDDFISKPFRHYLLLEKLANYLNLNYKSLKIPIHSSSQTLTPLTKADLQVMPIEWLKKLQLATLEINDLEILELIKEIPETETHLINNLTNFVKNFRLDWILELIEEY